MTTDHTSLIECRISGQIDYAQWERHCADTPGLAEAYTAYKASNGIPLTRAERGVVLPEGKPLKAGDGVVIVDMPVQMVCSEPEPMTRDQAAALGKRHAAACYQYAYLDDARTDPTWQPHNWVIESILAASKGAT